jgi:hypothetical protein
LGLSIYFQNRSKYITNIRRGKKSDKKALKQLLTKISQYGNINDPNKPKPLVTLEDFFIGNNDFGSVGYNFYPDQPSPHEFYEHF